MLRQATLAGEFYPANPKELKKIIDKFLAKVKSLKAKGEVFGLLLPHADYNFSGQVAAYGFKLLLGEKFDTVIILSDSHYERFDGVSVWPEGFWQTPLGKAAVDEDLARKILSASKRFFRRDSAHLFEHSIEVHLPFLQKVLKNFKIVPIVFGSEDKDWKELAKVILKNIKDKKILIIASADLSHGFPRKKARIRDRQTLKNILNLKTENLEVCAPDSVKILMEIAKKLGAKPQLLKYKFKEVGYASAVFYYE